MPVRAIADLAHARGALVIVDGAQSGRRHPGRRPRPRRGRLRDPRPEVAARPGGHGRAGRHGRRPRAHRAEPGGWFAFERIDSAGDAAFWPSARRFEGIELQPRLGHRHRPLDRLAVRCSSGCTGCTSARRAWRGGPGTACAAIDGVDVLTPELHHGDARVVPRRGLDAAQAVMDELGARVFAIVRVVPQVDAVRLSVGWFTSEEELDRVVDTVALLAAHTPETVPPRRTLTMLEDGDRGAPPGARHAGPPARLGGGPLAAVPQRAAAGRPGGPRQPGHRGRAGRPVLAYDVALAAARSCPAATCGCWPCGLRRWSCSSSERHHLPRRPAADAAPARSAGAAAGARRSASSRRCRSPGW